MENRTNKKRPGDDHLTGGYGGRGSPDGYNKNTMGDGWARPRKVFRSETADEVLVAVHEVLVVNKPEEEGGDSTPYLATVSNMNVVAANPKADLMVQGTGKLVRHAQYWQLTTLQKMVHWFPGEKIFKMTDLMMHYASDHAARCAYAATLTAAWSTRKWEDLELARVRDEEEKNVVDDDLVSINSDCIPDPDFGNVRTGVAPVQPLP